MSDLAIHAENLSKSYRITHSTGRGNYRTLQEELVRLARSPFQRNKPPTRETFWALQDVSFDIRQGEAVGIIGRNGAGKSTLLKILSRITKPTSGYAEVYGRVGSLLEVGTGFHPELTGRENIYLNGAVLGMSRRDIRRQFDAIVAFAEIEQFLDTPVKRYSSGMYTRLAFSVAAHLEPEVLVVDEVLAVGDAKFQEKSIGKMNDVAKSGRTVLFVSHNMAAVQHLCTRGVVLDHGKVRFDGTVDAAIAQYMAGGASEEQVTDLTDRKDRSGRGSLRLTRIQLHNRDGELITRVLSGQDLRVRFYYTYDQPPTDTNVNLAFNVYNSTGVLLTNLNTRDTGQTQMRIADTGYFECRWDHFNLRSGIYSCAVMCEVNGNIEDWLQSAFQIRVDDGDFYGTGSLIDRTQGDLLVMYDWSSVVELSDHREHVQ